jgi:glycine cleavage system aminomethyltransferase T
VSASLPNPLIALHSAVPDVETIAYDQLEIVNTFGDPSREYGAIYEGCGLMDMPQRGVLELTGPDRLPFLNNLISNVTWDKNTKKPMPPGTGVYAFFLNLRGRIVADMNVIDLGDCTIVETDVRKVELLRQTWDKYLFVEKVTMTNRVGELHEMALHGPKAADVLRQATGSRIQLDQSLAALRYSVFGIPIVLFRNDTAGVPGFHLLVPMESASFIWTRLTAHLGFTGAGKGLLRPIGWAAFNAARIEAGRPLLDIDLPSTAPDRPGAKLNPAEQDAATSTDAPATPGGAGVLPGETGSPVAVARAVSYTKCYVGQEVVARMHARKVVARQLVGIAMVDDALPLAGATVFDAADNAIGAVTSSTISPQLDGKAIALAMVKRPHFATGTVVRLPAEGKIREATVVELPFVKG